MAVEGFFLCGIPRHDPAAIFLSFFFPRGLQLRVEGGGGRRGGEVRILFEILVEEVAPPGGRERQTSPTVCFYTGNTIRSP